MKMLQMRFPGGRKKAVTLSYDDGVEQDQKLIEIMRRYGLKGTFNVNSGLCGKPAVVGRRLSMEDMVSLYPNAGMEVAVHSYTHPYLDLLPPALCAEEIRKDRAELEANFHTLIRGMAYPMGTYSEKTVQAAKMLGIAYARTTESTGGFGIPEEWLRLRPTCRHADPRLMELARGFVEDRIPACGKPQLFYLWGHSYEFDMQDNWSLIGEFAAAVGNREEIWYATNMEIYDCVEGFRNLQFSLAGDQVYNPSCKSVYLDDGDRQYCIGAGETIRIGHR